MKNWKFSLFVNHVEINLKTLWINVGNLWNEKSTIDLLTLVEQQQWQFSPLNYMEN